MKSIKISLLLAFTFLMFNANAQIQKRSFLFGANVNFDLNSIKLERTGVTSNNLPTTFNLTFNPKFGYFISNNFAIGIDLNLNYGKDTITNSSEAQTTTQFLVGPMLRYYFPMTDYAFLFFEGSVGVGIKTSEDYSKTLISGGAGPGLSFFLTESIAVEGVAKYNYIYGSNSEINETINNVNFSLGLIYYYQAKPGSRP